MTILSANSNFQPLINSSTKYPEIDARHFVNRLAGAISVLGYNCISLYPDSISVGANKLRDNLIALDCFDTIDCRKDILVCRDYSFNTGEYELSSKLKSLIIWGNAKIDIVNNNELNEYKDLSPRYIELLYLKMSREKAFMLMRYEKFKCNDDKFLEALEDPAKEFCLKR